MNKDVVTICIVASEKASDKKSSYKYFLRLAELNPEDIPVIKKILVLSHEFGDKKNEEIYTKKFSDLNPSDKGLKYRLAGFYVNTHQFEKANKICYYNKLNVLNIQNLLFFVCSRSERYKTLKITSKNKNRFLT